ncbi:MAG: MFS transporter, partial [Paraburkholderia sp.]
MTASPESHRTAASAVSPSTPSAGATLSSTVPYLERGTHAYWRASVALLFAGYATFS